mgnify:CR=1 FL=1
MKKYFDRFEKIIVIWTVVGFVILAVTNQTRATTETTIVPVNKKVPQDNYKLFVYKNVGHINLRKDISSTTKDSNESLENGELFVPFKYAVTETDTSNFPQDNETRNYFQHVGVFTGNSFDTSSVALQKIEYYNGNKFMTEDIRVSRYSQEEFISAIFSALHDKGLKNQKVFKYGRFQKHDGFYGTQLLKDSKVYDKKGKYIMTLKKGTFIFSNWNFGFSIGRDNESLIRFIGYKRKAENNVTVNTFFLQGERSKDGKLLNVATTIDQNMKK